MEIWLPLTPVIVFYLFIFRYNRKRKRRTIWKGKVLDNFIIIFILSLGFFAGIAHILDPKVTLPNLRHLINRIKLPD